VNLAPSVPPRFGEVAARLAANGYQPVPLIWGEKKTFLKKWTGYAFEASDAQTHGRCGTGILCGRVIGVDSDVRDPALAAEIDALALSKLGPGLERVGQAPKRLRVYRVAGEPFDKITGRGFVLPGDDPLAKGYKAHHIEVLAKGQQFAAFNMHPDTKQPYRWNGDGSPLTVPMSQLPLVTHAQLMAFMTAAEALLAKRGTPALSLQADRSRDLLRRVGQLVRGGATDEQIHVQCDRHPHAVDQGDPQGAVDHCISKARGDIHQEQIEALVEMNALHALINWKGRPQILTEKRDPTFNRLVFELSSPTDLKVWYESRPTIRKQNRVTWWLKQAGRREFHGVVFAPLRDVPGYYNLWHGYAVEPHPGDCSLFNAMIRDLICSGNEAHYRYVIAWCADVLRNPTNRPGVTLVLRGGQGIGKGTLARTLGRLFGDHFLHVSQSRHVVGNFNAHLVYVILLFADEALYAGDKQAEGALKALITEPELAIELKGKDVIVVQNHVHVIMASNQDWVVPAGLDDRRFAVFDVSEARAQDHAYWKRINHELDNGGREAWMHELLTFDLSGVDLRNIPETRARMEQKIFSSSPIQKWWYGRLRSGAPTSTGEKWLEEVPTGELFDDYALEAGVSGIRYRGTLTEFGIALKKLVPGLGRRQRRVTVHKADARRPEVKKDIWVYVLPSLQECRKAFAVGLGREDLRWPDGTETGAADRSTRDPNDF